MDTDTSNELKVIKQSGNFELIQVSFGNFCVRKTFKSFFGFGPVKKTFICLDRVGVSFEYENLTSGVTVGTFDRCEYVFNCNVLKAGGI